MLNCVLCSGDGDDYDDQPKHASVPNLKLVMNPEGNKYHYIQLRCMRSLTKNFGDIKYIYKMSFSNPTNNVILQIFSFFIECYSFLFIIANTEI